MNTSPFSNTTVADRRGPANGDDLTLPPLGPAPAGPPSRGSATGLVPEPGRRVGSSASGIGSAGSVRPRSSIRTLPYPHRIGGYRILGVLGAGGMGIVYRAQQDRPHRIVAVKLMRPGLLTPRLLRRFEYEAEVLGRLQHEGIARIYEAGLDYPSQPDRPARPAAEDPHHFEELGQPFFAMELVEGLRIDEYAKRNELSREQRLRLIVKVCEAVHYAHKKGVVHRDLKPANILVTGEGQPKVLDFGVARLTDADAALTATFQTATGQVVGTLSYMAPEQVAGRADEVDMRSDVYALGVIAYELLVGRPPLKLSDRPLPEAMRLILEEEPTRLSSFDRSMRGDLETIISKALTKERDRRYGSAAAFAHDIERFLKNEPIAARPASGFYYLSKFARRNKVLFAAMMLGVLGMTIGLVGTSWGLVKARREAEEVRRQMAMVQATREYLIDAFRGVDPHHAQLGRPLNGIELVRHAVADLEKDKRFDDQPLNKADLQNHFAAMLVTLGRPMEAEPLYRSALRLRERHLGPDAFLTVSTAGNLAGVLLELGRGAEAEPLFRTAHEGTEKLYGPDHTATLRTVKNLGTCLLKTGRDAEAEPLLRRALEGREKHFGAHYGDTLLAARELGNCLMSLNRPREAEPLLWRALQGLEKAGPRDPDALQAAGDLANALQALGKNEQVEKLLRRSHEGFEKLYGRDHPSTLRSGMNLASWLLVLRRPGDAEPLLRSAARGFEITLGGEHPSTLAARNVLANALEMKGEKREAEQLFRDIMGDRERVLGLDHPDTLRTIEDLAVLLGAGKRPDEAEGLMRRVVETRQRVQGARHPDTLRAMGSLAQLLVGSARLDEAEAAYVALLADFEAELGAGHRDTLITAFNLADVLQQQGRLADAEPLYERAATGMREAMGPKHPATEHMGWRWARLVDLSGDAARAQAIRDDFGVLAEGPDRRAAPAAPTTRQAPREQQEP